MEHFERPLDMLNASKGKEVIAHLKNKTSIAGLLMAFDININVVLDNAKEIEDGSVKKGLGLIFIRGDSIVFISPN